MEQRCVLEPTHWDHRDLYSEEGQTTWMEWEVDYGFYQSISLFTFIIATSIIYSYIPLFMLLLLLHPILL